MNSRPGKTLYLQFKKTNGMAKPCMYNSMKLTAKIQNILGKPTMIEEWKRYAWAKYVRFNTLLDHFDNKNINNSKIIVNCIQSDGGGGGGGGGGGDAQMSSKESITTSSAIQKLHTTSSKTSSVI